MDSSQMGFRPSSSHKPTYDSSENICRKSVKTLNSDNRLCGISRDSGAEYKTAVLTYLQSVQV